MKHAIVLGLADLSAAILSTVQQHLPNAEILDVTPVTNSSGDVEFHVVCETGAATEAKPAATRGRRGSGGTATAEADTSEAEAKPTTTRRGRGTAKAVEAEEDQGAEEEAAKPAATRTRRTAAPKVEAPTVPVKSVDDYDANADGFVEESDTYWKDNESGDVFKVEAGQELPDEELYSEIDEAEALEAVAPKAEAKPATTRSRRGAAAKPAATEEAEETATTTTTRSRRRGTAAAEEAPAAEEAAPTTSRRRVRKA